MIWESFTDEKRFELAWKNKLNINSIKKIDVHGGVMGRDKACWADTDRNSFSACKQSTRE